MCTIHEGDSESPCILVKDLLGKTHGYAALNPVLPANEDDRASAEHEICYKIRVLANAILRDAISTGMFNQGKQREEKYNREIDQALNALKWCLPKHEKTPTNATPSLCGMLYDEDYFPPSHVQTGPSTAVGAGMQMIQDF
ncbi:hypothetical protein AAL_06173 [Moelleriella libera RCEF 2490]|uniref:Uncharacterized protein n=1 Tax=Moelleriella libera RCEF 2490 TaxID=1081109 RepID=A0A167ZEB2_9HYPO|nr:hypothetical protein AAL_06173 [Moelleriella libera RCEF 2490]